MLPKKEMDTVLSPKLKNFLDHFPNTLFTYIPDNDKSGHKAVIHSEIFQPSRQAEGYGVFFSVNGFTGGKRSAENLTNINCLFCDIDYPDKMNRTEANLSQYKSDLSQELFSFDVVPSALVETKNGLHVYWILEKPIIMSELSEEQAKNLLLVYRQIEEAILKKFDGDPGAKDVSRVLRVPGTTHQKDPNNPFIIKLTHFNDECVYTFSELRSAFLRKDAPDSWAEVNVENPINDEVKKSLLEDYPLLTRPSYKKLLDPKFSVPEGMRNKALLVLTHACKESGWSIEQCYEKFSAFQGLNIREARKTIRSAYDHNYDFGYNNEVMVELATPTERKKLSEITSKILSKTTQVDRDASNWKQKTMYLTYEQIFSQRHENLKYKQQAEFYDYIDGVYKGISTEEVRSMFLREMFNDGLLNYRKSSAVNDKIACFKSLEHRTFTEKDENPNPNIVNLNNGLLDIETNQVYQHSPKYLSTVRIPITFDLGAKCPRWLRFIHEVSSGDEEQAKLLQQIAGYCLTSDTSFGKAFILFGQGANGKGIFTKTLSKLIGSENVRNMNLDSLVAKFGLYGIVGKRLNVIDEISGRYFESNIVKNMVTGEPLSTDVKYQPQPFDFIPTAKLLFTVNELPKINDTTPGLYRRFILIPFEASFEQNPELDLEQVLAGELSGILNWAVQGLKMLRADGRFNETEKNFKLMREFKAENSPLIEFFQNNYEPVPGGSGSRYDITASKIYSSYRQYCFDSGYKPKAMANFFRELQHTHLDGWDIQKIEVGRLKVLRGLRLIVNNMGDQLKYIDEQTTEQIQQRQTEFLN